MATYDSLMGNLPPFGHLIPPPDLASVADRVGARYLLTPRVQRVLPKLMGSMLIGRPERRLGPALWGVPHVYPGGPTMIVTPFSMSAERWAGLSRRRALVPVVGYEITVNPYRPKTFAAPHVAWLAAVYSVVSSPEPRTAYFGLLSDERGEFFHLLEAHFDEWLVRGNLPKGMPTRPPDR